MEYIDFEFLKENINKIKSEYQSKKPFRYVSFDGVLLENAAEKVLSEYPTIKDGTWDNTTYIDQRNKFQKRQFDPNSSIQKVFDELNSREFLNWLNEVTEIEEELIPDHGLFGGGLHQSINGAFLNVHVDYNIHPETKYHRRLNTLVYMNKDWKDEYEGHLELWDFTEGKELLLDKISPKFNRCVIFETNEISFHGHPKPLNTPEHVNRKSLATYYYTKSRPTSEIAEEHNTIYKNTEGTKGQFKRFSSGLKALKERLLKK